MYIWTDETNKLFYEVEKWLIPSGVRLDAPDDIKRKSEVLFELLDEEEKRQIEDMFY